MRISDWSSDVCSSDLSGAQAGDAWLGSRVDGAGFGLTAAVSDKGRVREAGLRIQERVALDGGDAPAGGGEHRVAGGGVPFHGRAEARVEVSVPGRDEAEFQRAADRLPLRNQIGRAHV